MPIIIYVIHVATSINIMSHTVTLFGQVGNDFVLNATKTFDPMSCVIIIYIKIYNIRHGRAEKSIGRQSEIIGIIM